MTTEEIKGMNIKILKGGYELNGEYILNSEGWNSLYAVVVRLDSYYGNVFIVDANYEQGAVDRVADFLQENELKGFYEDWDSVGEYLEDEDVIKLGYTEAVDKYVSDNGLTTCGENSDIYLELIAIEELK